MFEKVAIIGDSELVFSFQALGIKVFSPQDLEEARECLRGLEKEDVALCFLQEDIFQALEMEREDISQKFCPVVVGYSDYRKITDYLGRMMREMAVKATGSDSLVKRRKKDETR
jgi:vacuolar-type H+-ATPase subunit F/Vma7